ncbi:hypothetical protein B2G71_00825 [Novosphingobium sp. PC22D]|uniref:DUF2975 domain-containing protein n=1 Tax=Novosphingobium sp. PC22D TaxID=1962403 RepID=UPI000BF0F960|nr:DUF2975 domain-containing protein [Novosphingobium sp. PC22D]PEQ14186.1 hypothetical protein B2G71_00825 [Novosphingobium sp. PC22D]
MTSITRDPLLAIAKGVLYFLMAVMALGVVACLVAAPCLWIFQDLVSAEVAKEAPGFPMSEALIALSLLLLLVAAMLGMLFRIFQLLKRIVDTVGEGDPFVPENASRLTRMAWLTLAVQVVTFPMGGIGMYIYNITEPIRDADDHFTIDSGLDANGLLLMLILFILARVFRKGSEMRADLEGTV